jgi:hypothetical protein
MVDEVTEDQFEISDGGIKHVPTGAHFVPHPGAPYSGNMQLSNLGNRLKDGRDFKPNEVRGMMERLWAQHVARMDATKKSTG